MGDTMFQVGDIVQYKNGAKFTGRFYTAKIESIWSKEIYFDTGTWMFSSQAEKLLEVIRRGNNMNNRSAELLDRVAQLVREGENPVSHFQFYSSWDKWETFDDFEYFFKDIIYKPEVIREKPQTMNLGGYEIPTPIQNRPPLEAKLFIVDHLNNDVKSATNYPGLAFSQNLAHYDKESAQKHLDVLNKLHGVG